ncbi:MAG: TIGR02757 family protein [Deltaproteobacteria bacterium]|nr:TIGR02757 family protein [Deltaproteobacteria bacterium]
MDRFLEQSDLTALTERDPVAVVRGYTDPEDQEVAGLLVAALAYGRARLIQTRTRAALEPLSPSPARAIAAPGGPACLSGFVYRFQRGEDLPRFLTAIARVRGRHGSLAAAFARELDPRDADYGPAMDRWISGLRRAVDGPLSPGLAFLLPRVGASGAAKRLCLYLRWMVRPAGPVDLGAWQRLSPVPLEPAKLIIPLDTHIERIGRYIGLTERKSGGLTTAREITERLRALRPEDPLAYDLALCHLGISGRCPRRRDPVQCQGCPIRGICRLGPEPAGWAPGKRSAQRSKRAETIADRKVAPRRQARE